MGSLQKLKTKMTQDRDFQKMIPQASATGLSLDLNGDGRPEILLTCDANGDVDLLCIDIDGDGTFSFSVGETEEDGLPKVRYKTAQADVPSTLIAAASRVRNAVLTGDYLPDTLKEKLDELATQLQTA